MDSFLMFDVLFKYEDALILYFVQSEEVYEWF